MNIENFLDSLKLDGEIIDTPFLEETKNNGDKLYRITIRKCDDNLMEINYEYIYFWVLNEGKLEEKVYIKKYI